MKRKQKSAPLKTKNVVLSIAVCGFVCLAGIGYVWAKAELNALGRQMKGLETRLDELKRRNGGLVQKYAEMCSPRELTAAVRRANLDLAQPSRDRIVVLPEPGAGEEKRYAANVEGQR
jgi:hypothetical protein